MLDVVCTHCCKTLKIPEEYMGQKGKCNHCQGEITVTVAPPKFSAEVVEPGEDGKRETSTLPQAPLVKNKLRAFFRARQTLWEGVSLAVLLSSAMLVGWLIHAKGGLTDAAQPPAGTISTVTSFADASRRLELRGYRYVKGPDTSWGEDSVTYERQVDDALFAARISRWTGSQPILSLNFYCRATEKAFNSPKRRLRLCQELGSDACAMVNGELDYRRAVADMRELKENRSGSPQIEGQATTSEGWQFTHREYTGHRKPVRRLGEPNRLMTPFVRRPLLADPYVAVAVIDVTNLEREENIPPSARLEIDKRIEEREKKLNQKDRIGVGIRDAPLPPQPAPVPKTTGQWAVIAQWEGEAAKDTETFTVGSEWCLDWNTEPGEFGEGNFLIYINSSPNNLPVAIAANVIGANTDVSYQHSAGTYYLTIYATQPYTVRVFEKR